MYTLWRQSRYVWLYYVLSVLFKCVWINFRLQRVSVSGSNSRFLSFHVASHSGLQWQRTWTIFAKIPLLVIFSEEMSPVRIPPSVSQHLLQMSLSTFTNVTSREELIVCASPLLKSHCVLLSSYICLCTFNSLCVAAPPTTVIVYLLVYIRLSLCSRPSNYCETEKEETGPDLNARIQICRCFTNTEREQYWRELVRVPQPCLAFCGLSRLRPWIAGLRIPGIRCWKYVIVMALFAAFYIILRSRIWLSGFDIAAAVCGYMRLGYMRLGYMWVRRYCCFFRHDKLLRRDSRLLITYT